MKQMPVELDHVIVEYLMAVDNKVMSDELFLSRGIHAIYVIKDRAVVLSASSEIFLNESVQRMKETLAFKVLAVEDQEILRKSEWKTLNKEILNMYNTPGRITVLMLSSNQPDNLIVAGFIEPVKEASKIIEEFLETNSKMVTIHVKCAAVQFIKEHKAEEWKRFVKTREVTVNFHPRRAQIKLSGESIYLKPAVNAFKRIASSLFTDELKITEPGAKKYFQGKGSLLLSTMFREYGCVVVLQNEDDENYDDDNEDDGEGDEKFTTFSDSLQLHCKVQMACGVLIAVCEADICKFQADAVVSPSNNDLQLTGGLALALLNAAGPQLQTYCDRYTSRHGALRFGDAIITDAGHLPSKYVILTVSPPFKETHSQLAVQCLTRAITESLDRASGANCTSIAIPAISSGICGFPLDLCTDTIAIAVRNYFKSSHHKRSSSLNKVYLVNNDSNTVNAMARAVEKIFHDNLRYESPQALFRPSHLYGNQWEGGNPWQRSSTRPYSDRGERERQTSSTWSHSDRRRERHSPSSRYAHSGFGESGNLWEGERQGQNLWQRSSTQMLLGSSTTQQFPQGAQQNKNASVSNFCCFLYSTLSMIYLRNDLLGYSTNPRHLKKYFQENVCEKMFLNNLGQFWVSDELFFYSYAYLHN